MNPIPQDANLRGWIKTQFEDPTAQQPRPLPTGCPAIKPDSSAPLEGPLILPCGERDPRQTNATLPGGQIGDDRFGSGYKRNGVLR